VRVLMLTSDLQLGGVERTILNRVQCLRGMGVECAVAGLFEGRPSPGRARRLLERDGFEVFCAGVEGMRDVWRLAGLRRFVVRWRPDVVHCHLFHGHLAGLLLRLGGLRAPMVWSYHSVGSPRRPARDAFYRLLCRAADAHVFVSEAVRAYQRRAAGAVPGEEVIHNGIEVGPFFSIEPRAGSVFGAVGRFVPLVKGFDLLIRAFARLARRDASVRLKIAGDGPERPALEELIRAEGVGARAELVGFVEDVPGFLSGVNVFVNPSRWEAFGNTLVEGMAAGLPCVASRVGGLPEIGGDLVRWVPPGDVDALYAAMRDAVAAGQSSDRMARQRRRVAQQFSREAMTRRYVRLYASVADVRGGRRQAVSA